MGSGTPCLYILDTGIWIEDGGVLHPVLKVGTTWHPETRKLGYLTSHPNPPVYAALFTLAAEQFATREALYALDGVRLPRYLTARGLGAARVQRDGGCEWFWADFRDKLASGSTAQRHCAFSANAAGTKSRAAPLADLLADFLINEGIVFNATFIDIYDLRRPDAGEVRELTDEDSARANCAAAAELANLREKFLGVFLGGASFRRVQRELWERLAGVSAATGIIQWPTGVGKTIAILMALVLAAAAHRSRRPFRALVVAPKNDILGSLAPAFRRLEEFGFAVAEGFGGKMAALAAGGCALSGSDGKPSVLLATHAAMVAGRRMATLPPCDFVLYDEAHRAAGQEFCADLRALLPRWGTRFVLGTSATPLTSDAEQHTRLKLLFGDPLPILHRCDYSAAITEGWIARPRFNVYVQGHGASIAERAEDIGREILALVEQRRARGMWRGGRVICYFSKSVAELSEAYATLKAFFPPPVRLFTANSAIDPRPEAQSREFLAGDASGEVRILLACQKFREGSDIQGLEMNAIAIGDTIEPYILVQVAGRALRLDYEGKEGWCNIFKKARAPGERAEEVFLEIFRQIVQEYGLCEGPSVSAENAGERPTRCEIASIVGEMFGTVCFDREVVDKEAAVELLQRLYARDRAAAVKARGGASYATVKAENICLGLQSREEYEKSVASGERVFAVADPLTAFGEGFVSWADFLGFDVSAYPPTLADWKRKCREENLETPAEYLHAVAGGLRLPAVPSEIYPEFTNLEDELCHDESSGQVSQGLPPGQELKDAEIAPEEVTW